MASPKPAVIVRREFEFTPDVVTQQLRACIVGPTCQLVRYSKSEEKAKGLVATIASLGTDAAPFNLLLADTNYSIPNIASTSALDLNSVKLFIDDAYLSYAHIANDSSAVFTNNANSITFASSVWKTGNGSTRQTSGVTALSQDVAVGDMVQLYNNSNVLLHSSTVTGFTAASVSATTGVTVGTLSATSTESTTVTATGVGITVGVSAYMNSTGNQVADPRIVGAKVTNYVSTVTANTGSAISLSIVSDTGLDNHTITAAAAGATSAMTSGAVITMPANLLGIAVGATTTFSITVGHTIRTLGVSSNVASSGAYSGTSPTVYVVSCTKGGSLRNDNLTFKVTTNNGADITSSFTLTTGLAAQEQIIGSYGVKVTFAQATELNTVFLQGFVKGDTFRITCAPATSGAIKTLIFADPTTASGTIYKARLSKRKSIEVPSYSFGGINLNWSVTNAADAVLRLLKLESQITVRDSSVVGGTVDVPITAGKVYMQYRAFVAIPREVGTVSSLDDITTQLGIIDPENELAYGVYKAWSNANGAEVHFIGTVSTDLNGVRGFADALSLAKGNRNCYGLVPLSNSSEVWNAFVAHAKDESAANVGRFRIVWIAPEIQSHNKIQDLDSNGEQMFGTSSVLLTGYQIDITSIGGAALAPKFTETVQVGDYVRTLFTTDSYGKSSYSEFRVNAVIDNDSLVISATTNPEMTLDRIEIYRDLTSNALAKEYVKVAGGFSSERVFAVVPDRGINGLRVDGTPVKNQYIACAYAGLRAGSVPQQALSNVELGGFDGTNASTPVFDAADLDVLRDGGIWAVRNAADGKVYVERQLSTSTLDLYRKEQSVTCNVDSVSFSLGDGLRTLVGRVNITDATTTLVEDTVYGILRVLTATNGAITVGPQLLSFTIVSITVPATAQDTLVVKVQISVPLPMNVIDITLVI